MFEAGFVLRALLSRKDIDDQTEAFGIRFALSWLEKYSRKLEAHFVLRPVLGRPNLDDQTSALIRTDFILSAEIIVITLGTVNDESFAMRLGVLVAISALMTVGVYGLVAGIVKLDDAGLSLSQRASGFARATGRAILAGAPRLMKLLSIAGTAAMFLVGGGILVHGIPPLHHAVVAAASAVDTGAVGGVLSTLTEMTLNAITGIAAGGLAVAVVTLLKRLRPARAE
jgi:predicted DNA repair protein MutK